MLERNAISNSINIDPRIISREMEIEERVEDAIKENRYCVFCFDKLKSILDTLRLKNDYETYQKIYEMILECDEYCRMSYETGNKVNSIMNDPNYIAAIDRMFIGHIEYVEEVPTNTILLSIMKDGLINNGHLSSGAHVEEPSLALTASSLTGIGDMANLFLPYKENNATILLRFPKDMVDRDLQFITPFSSSEIYERKNGKIYIKPEYILGAIIKEDDQDKFYSREQLLSVKQKEMQ